MYHNLCISYNLLIEEVVLLQTHLKQLWLPVSEQLGEALKQLHLRQAAARLTNQDRQACLARHSEGKK